MVQATIKLIKNKAKSNISGSVSNNQDGSFRSYNITGKLVDLQGFVTKDGVNYDAELVEIDCPTTVLFFNQNQGAAVLARCEEIFEERAMEGDLNPAVDLIVEARTVRPRETNILITNVKHARIEKDTQLVDNSATVEDTLAKLRANSAKAQTQVQAARQGLSALAGKSLNLVKRHF